MTRADLPGPDAPSSEVLDELLKAFAADTTDEAARKRIDLSSPEVDELISGSPTSPPRPPTDDEQPPPVQAAAAPIAPTEPPPAPPATIVITDDFAVDPPIGIPPGDPLLAASAAADTSAIPAHAVEEGRVFIEDSSASDTITIEEAVTATRIEPRARERRAAVKKAKGRKFLKWFLIVFVLVALIVGGLAVLGSGLFAVEDVEIEGAERADGETLQSVVEELRGTPVLRVDTDEAEAALEAIPWVEDARVTTDFPHGVRIELRERTATAAYEAADGRVRVIDADGRVLEIVGEPPVDLLLVAADVAPDLPAGEFAPTGFRAAASLAEALTPSMRALAQSVVVTADGSDLRLVLNDGVEVRFGASEDLVAKLVRLQTWLDVGRTDGAVRVVDVSTDEVRTTR